MHMRLHSRLLHGSSSSCVRGVPPANRERCSRTAASRGDDSRSRAPQAFWRGGTASQRIDEPTKVFGRLAFPLHGTLADRMDEREPRRVQSLARERRPSRSRAAPAVHRIAEERVPNRGKMHADLVRASRFELAAQKRRAVEMLDDADVRACGPAVRYDRHRRARDRVPADRCVDGHGARNSSRRNREIFPLDRSRRELTHEIGLRRRGLCDHHETARVLVQTMHDARSWKLRERRSVMEQRVQKRPVAIAAARMDDELCRLVDHEDRVVLVDHRKRNRLRHVRRCGWIRGRRNVDPFMAAQPMLLRDVDAVDRDVAGLDPALEPAPRMLRQQCRERLIEAHACMGDGKEEVHRARRSSERLKRQRRNRSLGYNSRESGMGTPMSFLRAWRLLAAALLVALAAAGCNLLPEVKEETANWSAEQIYKEAHAAMQAGNYSRAVKLFDALESKFPYGRYAQ